MVAPSIVNAPRALVFPFRWTRVTKALRTRLIVLLISLCMLGSLFLLMKLEGCVLILACLLFWSLLTRFFCRVIADAILYARDKYMDGNRSLLEVLQKWVQLHRLACSVFLDLFSTWKALNHFGIRGNSVKLRFKKVDKQPVKELLD